MDESVLEEQSSFKIPVLQIRDFQLISQRAEGVKGILSPQVVQKRCIFLLPRSTKNGEN